MNALNCRLIGEFEKGEMIGEGTYGIVFFAKDKNGGEQLAIKKMKVLDTQGGFPMTSLREVKILRMLSEHPNIVSLKEVVVGYKSDSVFLVFEYCEIDLFKLMNQMVIDKATFSEGEVKCLSLQLIKGVIALPVRSATPTLATSSTATSNLPTSSSTRRASSKSQILDLPGNTVPVLTFREAYASAHPQSCDPLVPGP